MTVMGRGLGCLRDVRSLKDRLFAAHQAAFAGPPRGQADVDLWGQASKDQGNTSSCTGQAGAAGLQRALVYAAGRTLGGAGHAAAASLAHAMADAGHPLSARFAYRGALNVDGANTDQGSQLSSVARFLEEVGCCAESEWPFDEAAITAPFSFHELSLVQQRGPH